MSLFVQALLTSIIVWIGFMDKAFLHTFLYRPIVIGPLVGLVFGDLSMGLQVGVSVELMFLAVIFVGTAIPPDETISAGLATALACLTGSAEVGIATAIPISFVGQIFRQTRNSTIYEYTQRQVDKAAAEANPKKVILWTSIIPSIIEYVLFGVPTFVGVYFGASYVQAFIDIIPSWLVSGIAAGGGLLGAVGVALLLCSVKDKSSWPYFIVGFIFAAYLGINMIGIALIAVVCVAFNFYTDKHKELANKAEGYEVEEIDTSYRVITKKDLWRTFKYALAIESGNSTTRQEADGILQGMIPVIEKVYTDEEQKVEAYKRHCELFLTEGRMAALCIGISCAMEERNGCVGDIDPDSINSIKVALMGPLAGVGDSLIHGTLRPIMAGLACSMVTASNFKSPIGPVIFLLTMTIVGMVVRYFGIFKGYEGGLSLVANLQEGGMLDKLTKYAGIAAFVVCGGFISALVYVTLNISYVSGDTIISLQEVLDGLLPNLIPLLYTLLMYWLIGKKKVNIILLMFITISLGVIGVVTGVLL
ncbi:MAG: PTS system mannose/fructose/sorbose family transporter subunit IID [Erysipelotrichales bacterium]|nr:PTS system mannose/fructose/sorbose family transporter subunit IID [Erysipelotrichales bacterium]